MDKNRVSRSSYYIVVCLWDQLGSEIQDLKSMHTFSMEIKKIQLDRLRLYGYQVL